MKKGLVYTLLFVFVSFAALAALVAFSPISPEVWRPDPFQSLEGKYRKNTSLDRAKKLPIEEYLSTLVHQKFPNRKTLFGPEDIAVDASGMLYTGLASGDIVKVGPTSSHAMSIVYNTGGRPLGMRFDKDNQLIVADAVKGLIRVNIQKATHEVLADTFDGKKMLFVDHLDIAQNGDIYFSDASAKYSMQDYVLDFIEASQTGRIFHWRASDGQLTLIADGLFFANGVALSEGNKYLLINETGKSRILKLELTNKHRHQPQVFIDRLPGMPDNIYRDENNIFWVGVVAQRDERVEALSNNLIVRKILGNFPNTVEGLSSKYGMVIGIAEDGEIIYNLQGQDIVGVTTARPVKDELFLGFLHADYLAVMPLPASS